jgi:very-short-patch-repair endonuclease
LEYDKIRTEFIESDNIKIYRFTNKEIEDDLQLVLSKLKEAINNT